jgi:uncharacterized protein (DUF1778 family)
LSKIMTDSVKSGELEILERRTVIIPAKDWEAFLRWANRPPEELPRLKALADTKPTWDE